MSGQVLYDFENDSLDGWLQTPAERWEIVSELPLEDSRSLHHAYDNPETGVDYIGRITHYPDLSDTIQFSFRLRHAYNPSSGNNWQLFLLADDWSNLEEENSANSALLVGVNYNCSDDLLKLWQLHQGVVIEICTTTLNYQEDIGTEGDPLFRISRNPTGLWSIACSISGTEDSLRFIGSGLEHFSFSGNYAGFRYAYSSAQDRKLWIDQFRIEGHFIQDTVPPSVQFVRVSGLNVIHLEFNEKIVIEDDTKFSCESNELDSIVQMGNLVDLYFEEDFPNRKEQELRISKLFDRDGNILSDAIVVFLQDLAEFGDVVINEIMYDPEPVVYLPPCEYIEIVCRYEKALAISGWSIVVNERVYLLNDSIVEAGEYLVFTSVSGQCIYEETQAIPLFFSKSFLPNSGGTIRLIDQYGRLIHLVQYDELGRYTTNKSEGGWSLERIDPDNFCGGNENWALSSSWSGGTPGEVNSEFSSISDYENPNLLFIGIPEKDRIKLTFDEPVLLSEEMNVDFLLDNRSFSYSFENSYQISTAVDLYTNEALLSNHLYHLKLSDISDCAGNTSGNIQREFEIPVLAQIHFILINEVMYDPIEGGNEYIELYNPGNETIDLSDLKLNIFKTGTAEGSSVSISSESHLLSPGSFVVLCKNSDALREEWGLDKGMDLLELKGWKSLPTSGANIELLNRSEELIDLLYYSDSLHTDLISLTTGLALERISYDPCDSFRQCWTSAAASQNFGTPGKENSQFNSGQNSEKELILSPEVFSPNLDGYEDVLVISLPESPQNVLVDIFITDMNGTMIREIITRGNTGVSDTYFWDGSDRHGTIVLPGIYIVLVRISGSRSVKYLRKACALSYK